VKVFISFAKSDHRLVHLLSAELFQVGITPILAKSQFAFGARIDEKVKKLIRQSDTVVVLLTQGGSRSRWVQQEIGCAHSFNKHIIPLRTPGVEAQGMLAGLEHIEFEGSDPVEPFARLAAFLRGEAVRKGIKLRKTRLRKEEPEIFTVLHLPWTLVCPSCDFVENHVWLCMVEGDWLCVNCGGTVPPSSRPRGPRPRRRTRHRQRRGRHHRPRPREDHRLLNQLRPNTVAISREE